MLLIRNHLSKNYHFPSLSPQFRTFDRIAPLMLICTTKRGGQGTNEAKTNGNLIERAAKAQESPEPLRKFISSLPFFPPACLHALRMSMVDGPCGLVLKGMAVPAATFVALFDS